MGAARDISPVSVGPAELVRESQIGDALLVDVEGIGRVWLPKSVVHHYSEVQGGEETDGMLVVKRWFARSMGWS